MSNDATVDGQVVDPGFVPYVRKRSGIGPKTAGARRMQNPDRAAIRLEKVEIGMMKYNALFSRLGVFVTP